MIPFILLLLIGLFLLFLSLAIYFESKLFTIFAFAICIIIVYELVNTGIQYENGSSITSTNLNSSSTVIEDRTVYETVPQFWVNTLITIFAMIALLLIWFVITGDN